MRRPLISVTDFMNFEQVLHMQDVFKKNVQKGSQRQLHVGVMMSYKTLNNLPNRWQNIFPQKEKIASIFASDEVFNCLHYADYDGHKDLWFCLHSAIRYCGVGLNALQLDMIWPDPYEIMKGVRDKKIEVIIQVGRIAFEQIENNPEKLVKKLFEYKSVIGKVLLDKSGGHGIPMKAVELLPFMRAIRRDLPGMDIIVSGGLGPNSLHLLEPLLEEFPDVSIDAQGKLRPSGDAMKEPVDWDMAGDYLVKALKILK